MSKIEKFLAQPVEVELAGEKYMLKPFTLAHLPVLNRMGSKEVDISSKAFSDAIKLVMKQIDPEATNEQMENISISYLEELSNIIAKINNLDVEDSKKNLIENLKKRKEGE